jgi:ferredoxin
VRIDQERCQGHTLCAIAAPKIFGFNDEDGHAFVAVDRISEGDLAAVEAAIATCPEAAISLVDDTADER